MLPYLSEHERAELDRLLESEEPTGPADPLEWIAARAAAGNPIRVLHPVTGWTDFRPRDYQREVLEQWRHSRRIIVKSRQIGFSQTFGLEMAYKAQHAGPRRILCVSRNEDQAKDLLRYVRDGVDDPGDLVMDNAGELAFANSSRVKVQPAGPNAGRGFPASDVYLDEFAFAQWADAIYRAILPTVATGGSLTIFSSPNGRANLYYRLWAGQFGQDQWWRRRYDYSVLWDEEWADRQRAMMTSQDFAQEYGADFVESGGALFTAADLEACYREGAETEREDGHRYLMAGDPAGAGQDAFVWEVWDITALPFRLVAKERWTRAPFERYYAAGERLADAYQADEAWVDQTGLGAPMVEEIEARLAPKGVLVKGFTFTRKSKAEALTALQLLVQRHNLWHSWSELDRELGMYQADDEDLMTDTVMAAAIMAWATRQHRFLEWS